jgi:hypothetical protein
MAVLELFWIVLQNFVCAKDCILLIMRLYYLFGCFPWDNLCLCLHKLKFLLCVSTDISKHYLDFSLNRLKSVVGALYKLNTGWAKRRYTVYYILCTYFCPTLYNCFSWFSLVKRHKFPHSFSLELCETIFSWNIGLYEQKYTHHTAAHLEDRILIFLEQDFWGGTLFVQSIRNASTSRCVTLL